MIPQLREDNLTWSKINFLSLSEVSKISSYTSRYTPSLLGLHRSGKLLPTAKPLPLTISVWAEIYILSLLKGEGEQGRKNQGFWR